MNPMSWLFIPTNVRSKADVEKYCETCGQYQRAGGICKRHCSRRKRMMLETEEAAIDRRTARRVMQRQKKNRR